MTDPERAQKSKEHFQGTHQVFVPRCPWCDAGHVFGVEHYDPQAKR
jgi:hypothetical protein